MNEGLGRVAWVQKRVGRGDTERDLTTFGELHGRKGSNMITVTWVKGRG